VKLLIKENKELKQIIHNQAIEITKLRKRIEELEGKQKEEKKPDFIKDPVDTKPKKTGQKNGHKGYSRYIPERIDEIKPLDMENCPDCGKKLSGIQDVRSRIITDIEIIVKNIQYIIHRRYCKKCKKIVESEVTEALPNARFGLRLMLLVMLMKMGLRMPSNNITRFFELFSLKISDGEIYGLLNQLKKAFGSYYDKLVMKMRDAVKKHIDESSWRINGTNNWIWIFINKEIALYAIQKKRSSKVPIEILGNQEGKIITTDRFHAYNVLVEETGCLQQICWTHLLRNTKDLAEHYTEAKYVHKRFKYIYRKAKEGKTSTEKLLHWIDLVATSRTYKSTEVIKFLKNVCRKHRDDLFRFIDNPNIDPTNNLAERGLRHAVVMRKVSGGSRSKKGADTTAKLLSVIQTIKMQKGNIINNMINILQKAK